MRRTIKAKNKHTYFTEEPEALMFKKSETLNKVGCLSVMNLEPW